MIIDLKRAQADRQARTSLCVEHRGSHSTLSDSVKDESDMNEKRIPITEEIPKHKKKSNKKGLKRSDHKHIYETVLLHSRHTFKDWTTGKDRISESIYPTKVCSICGKIGYIDDDSSYYKTPTTNDKPAIYKKKELSDKAFELPKWEVNNFLEKFATKMNDDKS